MVVRYDALNRLEPPAMTLCNPGCVYRNGELSKPIGMLGDTEAEELILNFNTTSELNFRINRVERDNKAVNSYTKYLYKRIQNRRLLFLEDIGFFVITGVEDKYDDGVFFKDVSAKSADIELQQKNIPYIEDGTYQFYTESSREGILNRIVSALPLWDIQYVDPDVSEKYRTFEDVDVTLNCLAFLLEKVQDAYECIVLFDIVHRRISVYDQANYVKKTDVYITKDDVVNTLEISENADDLYTALRVTGTDELGISSVNPLGTNVIYNFDYYLDWMPAELSARVVSWQDAVTASERLYRENNRMFYMNEDNIYREESEIARLEEQKTLYSRCRDNIIAENGVMHVDEYNSEIMATGGAKLLVEGYYGTVSGNTSFWSGYNPDTGEFYDEMAKEEGVIYVDIRNSNNDTNKYNYNAYRNEYELVYTDVYGYYGTVQWTSEELQTGFWRIKNPEGSYYAYSGEIKGKSNVIYIDKNVTEKATDWSGVSTYNTGDCVKFEDKYYVCKNDNVLSETNPDEDSTNWTQTGRYLYDETNGTYAVAGTDTVTITNEISKLLTQIDGKMAQCDEGISAANYKLNTSFEEGSSLYARRDLYYGEIEAIRSSLAIDSYFEPTEYNELDNYIFEGNYTDEYITVTESMNYYEKFNQMDELYARGKDNLSRASTPTQEFSVDVESFIFDKAFQRQSERLETGCLIDVELYDDEVASLFLTSITLNYDDYELSLTFGNRYNKFDQKSLFENVLGKISKSSNTLNYIKELIQPVKDGEISDIQNKLQNSRNITMKNALASNAEEVVIDGTGYTGKSIAADGGYDPRQIKITGKNIVFTKDDWETCSTAIGEIEFEGETYYGVNAELVVGNVVVGNNIIILDEDGNDVFKVITGNFEQIATKNGDGDYEVDHVTTRAGFTFNDEGLVVTRKGTEIENKIDNTGMYVRRSGVDVLKANNVGVDAINLTAREYLTIGTNSMFADYNDGTDSNRTACFYIGE